MKKYLIMALSAATLIGGAVLFADDDERYEKRVYEHSKTNMQTNTPKRALNEFEKTYQKECGSCHMAYQPEFLPKRSWNKMMEGLDNHFEVDATLDPKDRKTILAYLTSNAGDSKYRSKHFSKMSNSVAKDEAPLRISETPYFIKEHRKIPKRLIEQKEVKSIANCTACHTTADKGIYSERAIKIPNYGRWDD
ncbi:diheme cytochrome c [Sulfurimonas sp. HSL-1716]|uniref:diheme cytochrome c n=1 Tax=Hydrocurvibacter sulfurireducens TaxID=3131937 RepID=UPI0031F788ED